MSAPWSDTEWELLKAHVHDPLYAISLAVALPHRTPNAIRQKMSALRREAEIEPTRLGPKAVSRAESERQRAAQASARYTAALLELVQ